MSGSASALSIQIRRLEPGDEPSFLQAHAELAAEGHLLGLGYSDGMPWNDYLSLRADRRSGRNVPDDSVPSDFLVAVQEHQILGRVSIRYRLNDLLRKQGGHLGYCVVPNHRRKGIATMLLQAGLGVLHRKDVHTALVTCDDDNVASARTIEKCGGVHVKTVMLANMSVPLRHYQVPCRPLPPGLSDYL